MGESEFQRKILLFYLMFPFQSIHFHSWFKGKQQPHRSKPALTWRKANLYFGQAFHAHCKNAQFGYHFHKFGELSSEIFTLTSLRNARFFQFRFLCESMATMFLLWNVVVPSDWFCLLKVHTGPDREWKKTNLSRLLVFNFILQDVEAERTKEMNYNMDLPWKFYGPLTEGSIFYGWESLPCILKSGKMQVPRYSR